MLARRSCAWLLPLLALATVLSAPSHSARAEEIVPLQLTGPAYVSEWEQLRDIALTIIRQYPPDRFHYVGIGQSPTPIIAILQNLSLGATNVPLSDIETHMRRILDKRAPDKAMKAMLYEHFGRFLPADEKLGGRQILVMDVSGIGGGEGISSAKWALATYAHETSRAFSVRSLALSMSYIGPEFRPLIDDELSLQPFGRVKSKMFGSLYKPYSQYGKFRLWNFYGKTVSEYVAPVSRTEYDEVRRTLAGLAEKDSEFKAHVRKSGLCPIVLKP
jgi:hypothetical protein